MRESPGRFWRRKRGTNAGTLWKREQTEDKKAFPRQVIRTSCVISEGRQLGKKRRYL